MWNIHDGMAQKALQSTNEEMTIGKHERKSKGMRMPAPEQGADFDHNKGILYGITMDNDEQNQEMLNKLAAKDAKIDESLDIVRAQLKGILAMHEQSHEWWSLVTDASPKWAGSNTCQCWLQAKGCQPLCQMPSHWQCP